MLILGHKIKEFLLFACVESKEGGTKRIKIGSSVTFMRLAISANYVHESKFYFINLARDGSALH